MSVWYKKVLSLGNTSIQFRISSFRPEALLVFAHIIPLFNDLLLFAEAGGFVHFLCVEKYMPKLSCGRMHFAHGETTRFFMIPFWLLEAVLTRNYFRICLNSFNFGL